MIYKFCTSLLFLLSPLLFGQTHTFAYTHSSFARAVSMGGAFTAVEDATENSLFNPAALRGDLYGESPFDLYVNPIGVADAVRHRDDLTLRNKLLAKDAVGLAGLAVRGLSYAQPVFQFSMLLIEQLSQNPFTSSNKGTQHVLDWHYHLASVRLTLADQVSIGATGYAFNHTDPQSQSLITQFGSSYGILMRPNDSFSAGVSFFSFPEGPDSLMFQQHRINNKSINIGVAFRPTSYMTAALDFRNVSQEENNSTNEIHAGVEITPASILALRAGYFRNYDTEIDTYSIGLGLADFRPYKTSDRFVLSKIILNYGLQFEDDPDDLRFSHYLTFLLRL